MTTTVRITATRRAPMDSMRRTALVSGTPYLIILVASIAAAFVFYRPGRNNPDYILSSGTDAGVLRGGFLEVTAALACIGTAIVLFPVAERQSEVAALGFVTGRVLEAALIVVGVVSLLSVVTLRQDLTGAAGADAASLVTVGRSPLAIHDRFVLGPGLIPAVNALCLGNVLLVSAGDRGIR